MQSNYKAAAEELTRALAIDDSNLPVLELRAALYEQLGEKAKFLADVEKTLQIRHKANPKDSLTLLQMGMFYMNKKQYDKASDIFSTILADHPDDVEAIRGRADARLNSGRRANALSDYERALKLKAHDVGILNNFAWLLATAPEDNLRDGHRALALATDACRQTDYKEDYILSTLAAAYAETGDFDSARKWAAQAMEVKPSKQAEESTKDELKKELQSYQANKPWREDLPIKEEKKDKAAENKDPQKPDTSKKSEKPAPKLDDRDPPSKPPMR